MNFYFNPRTPCGVRLCPSSSNCRTEKDFNPRTPCGVRRSSPAGCATMSRFQSTHPLRGATGYMVYQKFAKEISIHAPLAGCDSCSYPHNMVCQYFNPRTPCGVRPDMSLYSLLPESISIHAPLAGCDAPESCKSSTCRISIHAPLAGCDLLPPIKRSRFSISIHAPLAGCDFVQRRASSSVNVISIHAPLAGCDGSATPSMYHCKVISIHAPLAGCDGPFSPTHVTPPIFQSTHPLRGATAKLPKYSRQICEKATKFLQSRTKSGVAACWAKEKRPLFPALRGANLPGKTGTLPVRIR